MGSQVIFSTTDNMPAKTETTTQSIFHPHSNATLFHIVKPKKPGLEHDTEVFY